MSSTESYISSLISAFENASNPDVAQGQKAYMKHNFEFLGLKSPVRRDLQRPFLVKSALPSKDNLKEVIGILWGKPEREYQYFAQELAFIEAQVALDKS